MISMSYDLSKLPISSLLRPISDAGSALTRLDERIARSPVGQGWIERMHFADACASLWIDGELVHMEDLVLHEARADIRTPTHELTIARDVLRARRRIAAKPPGWALSAEGLQLLRRHGADMTADPVEDSGGKVASGLVAAVEVFEEGEVVGGSDALAVEFAAMDAALARSEVALAKARAPIDHGRDPLIYERDWDEESRLDEWRTVLAETESMPPVLRAVLLLDAWNSLQVLQHAPWLGRLLAAASLRQAGLTTASHLTAINLGLKTIAVDRRRHRHRDTRLAAMVHGLQAAAELGLKEHDRLALARQMMERKLDHRRRSSKLPQLIELVMAQPLVTAEMIAKALKVTPRGALRLVEEMGLREMTGRGRFRAWGAL
ncbi:RHE_PE00001 family protein [Rhizobium croatiense]|uniref:DUF1612 and helix-turn-helix domain-containing protein n=1 Tax=Rhizobium croatiense TaxID=2867516 RepID=A0ABS7M713_9HYPH|nr:RHE_PE00001 family protein [Rhizobium croatiense]MBY4632656.1 DUF1612 and helix-turn-helix domain-containing protein [Rhizobium croatiense]